MFLYASPRQVKPLYVLEDTPSATLVICENKNSRSLAVIVRARDRLHRDRQYHKALSFVRGGLLELQARKPVTPFNKVPWVPYRVANKACTKTWLAKVRHDSLSLQKQYELVLFGPDPGVSLISLLRATHSTQSSCLSRNFLAHADIERIRTRKVNSIASALLQTICSAALWQAHGISHENLCVENLYVNAREKVEISMRDVAVACGVQDNDESEEIKSNAQKIEMPRVFVLGWEHTVFSICKRRGRFHARSRSYPRHQWDILHMIHSVWRNAQRLHAMARIKNIFQCHDADQLCTQYIAAHYPSSLCKIQTRPAYVVFDECIEREVREGRGYLRKANIVANDVRVQNAIAPYTQLFCSHRSTSGLVLPHCITIPAGKIREATYETAKRLFELVQQTALKPYIDTMSTSAQSTKTLSPAAPPFVPRTSRTTGHAYNQSAEQGAAATGSCALSRDTLHKADISLVQDSKRADATEQDSGHEYQVAKRKRCSQKGVTRFSAKRWRPKHQQQPATHSRDANK